MVITWDVVVISVVAGFDQILKFEFESYDATNVVCGDYTASTPPDDGHVCVMYNPLGESSVRIRACNSAGCGTWSDWSTASLGGQECVALSSFSLSRCPTLSLSLSFARSLSLSLSVCRISLSLWPACVLCLRAGEVVEFY